MKLLFAHDFHIMRDESGTVYTSGVFPYSVWQRYLALFDELVVVGRKGMMIADSSSLSKSSGPGVSFVGVATLSDPISRIRNYEQVRRTIEGAMHECDAAIIRLPSEVGLCAIQVAMRLKKPFAVEVVGCAWDSIWYYGSWQGRVYAPLSYLVTRNAVKKSTCTMYVTQQFLQRRYPSSGRSFSCSNVEIDYDEQALNRRLEKIDSISGNMKMGLIGNLTGGIKGVDLAIKALRLVHRSLPGTELHVLGGGSPQHLIDLARKHGVANSVFFYGTLPSGQAVHRWLDDMDLYIQPSKAEGLPRALIEAMSRGCPSVGATAGGIPELLETDYLHRRNNGHELAARIVGLGSNRTAMREQAERNVRRAYAYRKEENEKNRFRFLSTLVEMIRR
jgi:glycosyltransferase involved in cell wall biosynthesis